VTFRLLFVLMILAHDRRRIVHVAITDHRPRPGRHNSCAMHFRKRRTSVSTARSRFGLCRRGDHHRGHEYSRRSYGTAIAEAERVRGTGHRLDPTRVPRSRHRDERGGTAADPQRLALDKDTPCPRSVTSPSAGRIVAIPEVGGLHHRYDRIAA